MSTDQPYFNLVICTIDGTVEITIEPIALHDEDGGDSYMIRVTNEEQTIVQEMVVNADKINFG